MSQTRSGWRLAAICTLLATAIAVTVAPGMALADQGSGNTYSPHPTIETYYNLSTGWFLDSNAAGQVYANPYNGGLYQQWYPVAATASTLSFIDVATNRCLDSNYNGQVYTLPCNSGTYQQWTVYRPFPVGEPDILQFFNKQTGRCLVNGGHGVATSNDCGAQQQNSWS